MTAPIRIAAAVLTSTRTEMATIATDTVAETATMKMTPSQAQLRKFGMTVSIRPAMAALITTKTAMAMIATDMAAPTAMMMTLP